MPHACMYHAPPAPCCLHHWLPSAHEYEYTRCASPIDGMQVALAVGLLIVGTVLLFTGVGLYFSSNPQAHGQYVCAPFISVGPLQGNVLPSAGLQVTVTLPMHLPAGTPLIIVGSLTFLPGFYYSRIAYLAWRGYRGYSLNLIPDF